MDWWLDFWQNLTPPQGTVIGGMFVLVAGIVAFGTGSLNRRSEAKRFHYEELKTLYAEALRIGRDLELLKAVPPDDREKILTETVPAMQQVISELALTGNYQVADLAIAYMYQQSVQLAGWTRDVESDGDLPRPGSKVDRQYDRRRAGRIEEVSEGEHQSSGRGTGCAQGARFVCGGVVPASIRTAKANQSRAICSELTKSRAA